MQRAPSIKFPRTLPLSVQVGDPVTVACFTYDEYFLRGETFAGQPVYCAPGWDVKEARMTLLVTARDVEHAAEKLTREVRRFVFHDFSHAVELDFWVGELPFSPIEQAKGLERQNVKKRCARLLAAVHT
jgi:hypothetical protein